MLNNNQQHLAIVATNDKIAEKRRKLFTKADYQRIPPNQQTRILNYLESTKNWREQ